MKCTHSRKKFLTFMDFRGWPEKLFVCEDCGMTISDFITVEDNHNYAKSHDYIPTINLGIAEVILEQEVHALHV